VRICNAKFGVLALSEGDAFRLAALHGAPPAYAEVRRREPVMRFGPGTATDRAAKTKRPVQIADVKAEPAYVNDPQRFAILELAGARTTFVVPMLKKNVPPQAHCGRTLRGRVTRSDTPQRSVTTRD
jgi:hypothetical protein